MEIETKNNIAWMLRLYPRETEWDKHYRRNQRKQIDIYIATQFIIQAKNKEPWCNVQEEYVNLENLVTELNHLSNALERIDYIQKQLNRHIRWIHKGRG